MRSEIKDAFGVVLGVNHAVQDAFQGGMRGETPAVHLIGIPQTWEGL